jgi:hypothetical protein
MTPSSLFKRSAALLVLCGGLVLSSSGAFADLASPEPTHQAGEVRGGVVLTHRFTIVNRGSEPIDVLEVKAGCGCLKPRLDHMRFEPNQQGELLLQVHTVTQPEGPNTWGVIVRYRRGDAVQELPLQLSARIVPEVSIRPANLLLVTDTTLGHELTLTERREQPLTIRATETMSHHVRVEVGEPRAQSPGGWVRTLRLKVLPSCPEGRHEDLLHVLTSDPTFPELKVPFTVVKKSPQRIRPAPAELSYIGLRGQELPARVVLLGDSGEEPIEIQEIRPSHPAIRCTGASGPGSRATLRVQIDQSRLEGASLQGTISVILKKPTAQTVTVPVQCFLR